MRDERELGTLVRQRMTMNEKARKRCEALLPKVRQTVQEVKQTRSRRTPLERETSGPKMPTVHFCKVRM